MQLAISEAKNTYDTLYDQNRMMQAKIKEMRERNHIFIDKTNEASMNEHKYLKRIFRSHTRPHASNDAPCACSWVRGNGERRLSRIYDQVHQI